jgi:hypothetical protein
MENRRELLKMVGLSTVAGVPLFGTPEQHIPNKVIDAPNAKLSRETFGDLRVFFEGPTGQLKAMTAGSLLLKKNLW